MPPALHYPTHLHPNGTDLGTSAWIPQLRRLNLRTLQVNIKPTACNQPAFPLSRDASPAAPKPWTTPRWR